MIKQNILITSNLFQMSQDGGLEDYPMGKKDFFLEHMFEKYKTHLSRDNEDPNYEIIHK